MDRLHERRWYRAQASFDRTLFLYPVQLSKDPVRIRRRNHMELFEELQWRGLVNDVTSPDLENEINNG